MNNTLYLFTGDFMSLTNKLILHLKSENTKIVLLVHHLTKQDYIYILKLSMKTAKSLILDPMKVIKKDLLERLM